MAINESKQRQRQSKQRQRQSKQRQRQIKNNRFRNITTRRKQNRYNLSGG